jgi:hypothetical protein
MKEQSSIDLRPHEATAGGYSMLFIAPTITPAVLSGVGFSGAARSAAIRACAVSGAYPNVDPRADRWAEVLDCVEF